MAKRSDKVFNTQVRNVIKSNLEKATRTGIAQGCYAISKFCLDIINDDMSDADKISKIKSFCETVMNNDKPNVTNDKGDSGGEQNE